MASYLGIDAGTQSLKAIVIGEDAVLAESAVHFGRDLPRYGAPNGFLPGDDPAVRHADPRMWTEALELARRAVEKVPEAYRPRLVEAPGPGGPTVDDLLRPPARSR